jgi:hypothetical protein
MGTIFLILFIGSEEKVRNMPRLKAGWKVKKKPNCGDILLPRKVRFGT